MGKTVDVHVPAQRVISHEFKNMTSISKITMLLDSYNQTMSCMVDGVEVPDKIDLAKVSPIDYEYQIALSLKPLASVLVFKFDDEKEEDTVVDDDGDDQGNN